eukprot:4704535-Amphidinium_carterae.1
MAAPAASDLSSTAASALRVVLSLSSRSSPARFVLLLFPSMLGSSTLTRFTRVSLSVRTALAVWMSRAALA